jgi:phage terminase large subunit-like protein
MAKRRTPSKRSCSNARKPPPQRKSYPATPAGVVQRYIDDVQSGRRVAGRHEKQAVLRHLNDLKKRGKKWKYRFDEELATQACNFFPLLKLTDGEYADDPFELKPFQAFIVWSVFGWVRISDRMRRYRYALIELARGNGKTPFLAGIALLCFAFDNPPEPRAECYAAATTQEQADRQFFDDLKAFIGINPQLAEMLEVHPGCINLPATGAKFSCLSSDGSVADGLRIHFAAIDEFHEWVGKKHRKLWGKLKTAMGKRRQPLIVIITTAGSDESDLWLEVYEGAVKVVDQSNKIEQEDLFVFICEIDDGDDPFDEKVWAKANPMLEFGVVKIDHLRSMANEATWNPTTKHDLVRYHCNKRITTAIKLIPPELWARGNEELPDLEGKQCHGGFDWGWKDDLAALALVFPLGGQHIGSEWRRRYATIVDAWIPEGTARDLSEEPWATWIEEGVLRVTPGVSTDTSAIYQRLDELRRTYGIATIAMDGNNAREFGSRIVTEFGMEAYYFGQNHGKYNEPTRELVQALKDDRFIHGGNPLLAWSAGNVVGSQDGRGYVKPEKDRSQDKIDPMCAVIMGLSEVLYTPLEGPSIYEEPGNLIL